MKLVMQIPVFRAKNINVYNMLLCIYSYHYIQLEIGFLCYVALSCSIRLHADLLLT
jgi:hypothetical protein